MTTTHIGPKVQRTGDRIGAEIDGVGLNAPLNESTVSALNKALLAHKVLVFRGQHLDDTGQIRFASLFGPLTIAHPTVPSRNSNEHFLRVEGVPYTLKAA